jgi:hypothetical protein
MRIAAQVAQHKERHPELFCPRDRCLWRTGDGSLCPNHKPLPPRGIPNPPTNRPNYTGD